MGKWKYFTWKEIIIYRNQYELKILWCQEQGKPDYEWLFGFRLQHFKYNKSIKVGPWALRLSPDISSSKKLISCLLMPWHLVLPIIQHINVLLSSSTHHNSVTPHKPWIFVNTALGNGLLLEGMKPIAHTNADVLSIKPLRIHFMEIFFKIQIFSFKKMQENAFWECHVTNVWLFSSVFKVFNQIKSILLTLGRADE